MESSIRLEANAPRPGWQQLVEDAGLIWHAAGESPYWTEDQHLFLTLKAAETLEDRQTIAYLAETAGQAGKSVELMDIPEVGFSEEGRFTDSTERPIDKLFKLYPWEWMTLEPFFDREGAGVSVMDRGNQIFTGAGGHHGEPIAYQKHASLFAGGGQHFVWGLWLIGDECRGLSARGDTSPITGNLSRFYPHRIE